MDPLQTLLLGRLQKNHRHLRRWLQNHKIQCWRLYDRELQEFPLSIDLYADWAHIQIWASDQPVLDDTQLKERVCQALGELLDLDAHHCVFKERRRQSEFSQYQKLSTESRTFVVEEGGLKLQVNLWDYLDTGLFLDHRLTRTRIRDRAQGKNFLNLFCYTGSVSVSAAAGGATSTTSVDLSSTYLDWAKRNFQLNQIFTRRHEFIQADVVQWLQREQRTFDLIFLDPPTFSRSKKMQATFDVQRDHVDLLRATLRRLAPAGELYFSTNRRHFQMHSEELGAVQVREISRATLAKDFERGTPPHRCYVLRHRKEP